MGTTPLKMEDQPVVKRVAKRPLKSDGAKSDGAKYVDERIKHLLECVINDNYEPGAKLTAGIASFVANAPKHLNGDIREYCQEQISLLEQPTIAPKERGHQRDTMTVTLDNSTKLLLGALSTRKVIEDAIPEPVGKKGKRAEKEIPTHREFVVSDSDLSLLITDTKARILKQESILVAAQNERNHRLHVATKIFFQQLLNVYPE